MQSDGSYQITTKKESFAAPDQKEAAYRRAELLCPKGFDTKSEFESGFREYTLIVNCRNVAK